MPYDGPATPPSVLTKAKIAVLIALGAYCALYLSLDALAFLDLPNHTTRAYIIAHDSPHFASNFRFRVEMMPYIIGDLLYAGILKVLPMQTGALVWMCLIFLSLPLSLVVYARSLKRPPQQQLILALVSIYWASSWHFLSAYTNYCLSVALAFLVLAQVESFLSTHRRWTQSLPAYAAYCALTFVLYGVHLAGFVFCAVMAAVSCAFYLFGSRRLGPPLLLGIPFLLLAGYHISTAQLGGSGDELLRFREPLEKFFALGAMFYRFSLPLDLIALLLFLISTFLAATRSGWKSGHAAKLLATAGVLLLCYLVLPEEMGPTSDIDGRALPFVAATAFLFLMGSQKMTDRQFRQSFFAASALVVANFGVLVVGLVPLSQHLSQYQALLQDLPPNQRLFPIATRPDVGRLQTNFHQAQLAIVSRNATVPYLFSERTSGKQFSYFTYLYDAYSPSVHWYLKHQDIDWQQVCRDYDFLIVTKPYDEQRIQVPHAVVSENPAGVLARLRCPASEGGQ